MEVHELTWRPFGRATPVLHDVTLQIEEGQRILLAGPSGSGKSTLLRALAGVLTTTDAGDLAGSIGVDGRDPHLHGAPAGLLVQDPADAMVAPRVGREVAFGPENAGLPLEQIWTAVQQALDAVGFPYGPDHPVDAVSGGEAQRLALAGVLALAPRLVLLDEPTSMLDRSAADTVRAAIWVAGRASGATMVLVEHQLDPWLDEVDRVIILDADGRISADGTVAETLLERGAAPALQGVWAPGLPAPVPRGLPPELCLPALPGGPVGSVVIRADAVGVVRRPRAGLASPGGQAVPASVQALSRVDASVRSGEVLAIVGVSGAGKSTLTALLAGLELPTSGTVSAGRELAAGVGPHPARWSSTDLARRVGWVPQHAELAVVARTVLNDVLSTSRALGLDEKASTQRADGLIEALGLSALRDADPHELSGGELRRLALAGALAHGPSVLVLDEPTVGQDRDTWAAVTGLILSARAAGVAVVVATHDPLLIALADRRIHLEHGRGALTDAAATPVGASAVAEGSGDADTPAPVPRRRPRPTGLARRCGPLSLLGSSLLLIVGGLAITDVRVAAACVAVELLLAPLVFGWARPSVRLIPGLLAVASVGFSNWLLSTGQDPLAGVTAGLRVAFFVLPGVLLAGSADPFALGDHLAQRLRLPARPVVAAVAALQRFEGLGRQWDQLRRIRRVRGLDAGRGPSTRSRQAAAMTFALLVQSLRQAGRMAVAMEARGFSAGRSAGVRRTWAEPAPWLPADSALLALGLIVAGTPILLQAAWP
ncbi:energy-coupling factor transport system ATP-binding protein [Cryobacterium psychrotolerans]|uniref:Energy-coupling factor transport system ATP-binding protein n=1 Tax=Cryobacterium psychrotolerans TaxID=386301 RepID=A0A1G9DF58_9MICO|nr:MULTISPECIES: ATP-binding cassette domain-containing protein [Cryobacterium]SDK62509.1 energy-coupling factor transport system ATP-binding protein [Cryobacterium psychrotolerans]